MSRKVRIGAACLVAIFLMAWPTAFANDEHGKPDNVGNGLDTAIDRVLTDDNEGMAGFVLQQLIDGLTGQELADAIQVELGVPKSDGFTNSADGHGRAEGLAGALEQVLGNDNTGTAAFVLQSLIDGLSGQELAEAIRGYHGMDGSPAGLDIPAGTDLSGGSLPSGLSVTPEPATLSLLVIGAAALLKRKRTI